MNKRKTKSSATTSLELARIMPKLNDSSGRTFRTFHDVAGRYINDHFPDQVTPSLQMRTAMLFVHACNAFLRRNGKHSEAVRYRSEADRLRQALQVLAAHDAGFRTLLSSGDGGACADAALSAIKQMVVDLEQQAQFWERDAKNITFFYCLGRMFGQSNGPLPSPTQAHEAYTVLCDDLRAGFPLLLQDIKPDDQYDPVNEGAEIKRLMQAGYAKTPTQKQ